VVEPNASEWSSIVEAAVLAPSADNHHPFQLTRSRGCIFLTGDRAYAKAAFHRKVLSLISFGAVTENICIRAAALGYAANVTWLPDAEDPLVIARIVLASGAVRNEVLDAAIHRRHTNRQLFFSGPPLSDLELEQFHGAMASLDGACLKFLDSRADRSRLLRLLRRAEATRFNVQSLHQELFASIRFDVGWHASAEEGLPPAVLGVEPGLRWAFEQLARWPVARALSRVGLHHALGFRAADLPCRVAPHCGVLCTTGPLELGALLVGTALERVWLMAESRGLAFQPFAGPGLLALEAYEDVPAAVRELLQAGWRALVAGTPLMVFRLGRARAPRVRTGRLPARHYVRA
jgi:hypothetical protein